MSSGRTVWLASYPKSGNTWVRAIITALGQHPQLFGVDHLVSGAQPFQVGMALGAFGVDPRWMDDEELDRARTSLAKRIGTAGDGPPVVRKTHERYRGGAPGREPFPEEATRGAVLVVRDPRDVACSYAPFFGIGLDEAIAALARDGGDAQANAFRSQTAQPWGTWSSHAQSWLDVQVPFPVHLVRYEDLHEDAVHALLPVLEAVGLPCSPESLADAVERARFDRLQESEAERGFRETSPQTRQFFRRGITGGWRDELSAKRVAAIESQHGEVMERLGYPLESRGWTYLPPALGITVREGVIPESLPGETRPVPWIAVAGEEALVRFANGVGVHVAHGREAVVSPPPPGADAAWLVHGWAVTLAMLQRGLLSLHAATVIVDGQVIAVAGERGAGKSTTAMGLRGRGHPLLCDDVTLVDFRDGQAWTTPFWRNVHLLEDTAEEFGLDFDGLPPLGARRRKAAFRPEPPRASERPLDRIVILAVGPVADVESHEPRGAARLEALLAHTRRDGVAPLVLGEDRYFAQVARLADTVPISVVTRPETGRTIEAVLDAIEGAAGE